MKQAQTFLQIALTIVVLLVVQSSFAQHNTHTITDCHKKVKLSEIAYEEGRLGTIDSLLQDCIKVGDHKIKVKVCKLLFMSALFLDKTKKARLYFKKFRKLMPRYRPEIGDHISLFDQAWLEFKSRKTKN